MIEYEDLLGLSYRADEYDPASGSIDCKGVVMEALRRGGVEAMPQWFEPGNENWMDVPLAQARPLDVIATDPLAIDSVTHVSAVIVAGASGFVISASERQGVHITAIARLRNIVGVYRART